MCRAAALNSSLLYCLTTLSAKLGDYPGRNNLGLGKRRAQRVPRCLPQCGRLVRAEP